MQNRVSEIKKQYGKKITYEILLGRLGGDEFAVLIPINSEQEGLRIAEGIRLSVNQVRIMELMPPLTVSLGGVYFPKHGTSIKELFTQVVAAVFRSKETGKNRTHFYQLDDRVLERMHSRVQWKSKIAQAIKDGRFVPWFQPILDLQDDTIQHYEILARMYDVNGMVVFPGEFIHFAEIFGVVALVDQAIIDKALQFIANVSLNGKGLSFSVNLSGKEIGNDSLLQFIKNKILETGADPTRLIFEITETTAINETEKAVCFIRELRSMGCMIALDDFGVGFTSFKYLQQINVDYIKIDGSFVTKLYSSRNDRLFVKAMVEVAQGMGVKTIAEFVENEETLNILKELDVDYAQGYLIGKPVPDINLIETYH